MEAKERQTPQLECSGQGEQNIDPLLFLLPSPSTSQQVSGADRFRGPLHCLMETLKKEGPRALYKGKKRKQTHGAFPRSNGQSCVCEGAQELAWRLFTLLNCIVI